MTRKDIMNAQSNADTEGSYSNAGQSNGVKSQDNNIHHTQDCSLSTPIGNNDAKAQNSGSSNTDGLTALGSKNTKYKMDYAPEVLEFFYNKHPENEYFVKFNCPEFTSLCPITGQPDFATIYISYVPDQKLVESKTLKLYLFSFRNHGCFHEDTVNIIMKDLIKLLEPKYIEVWGKFLPRGGLSIDPYCNYGKPGTRWEQAAWDRLSHHDMNPELINNR